MPDRTLVQTPQGEVKTLTVDEFIELEKTTIFKKNVGHEKKAKLDKQGNPVKDKHGNPVYTAGKLMDGWLNKGAILHWHSDSPEGGFISKQTLTVDG